MFVFVSTNRPYRPSTADFSKLVYRYNTLLSLSWFGHNFGGWMGIGLLFSCGQFWWLGELWSISKHDPWLLGTFQFKVVDYLVSYGRKHNVKLCPHPIRSNPKYGLLRWTRWVESGANWHLDPHISVQLLFTTQVYLEPFGHNTQCGRRQADRKMDQNMPTWP